MRSRFVVVRWPVLLSLAGACASASLGCGPTFTPASRVVDERLLAVRADPPEAAPGQTVSFTTLMASPQGTLSVDDGYSVLWTRCPDKDSDALGDFIECTTLSERFTVGSGEPFVDTVPADLFGTLPPPGAPAEEIDPPEKLLGALLGYWRVTSLSVTAGERRIGGYKRVPVYPPVPLETLDPRLKDIDVRLNRNGEVEVNTNPVLTSVIVHEGSKDGPTVDTVEPGQVYFFEPRFDDRALQEYFSLQVDFSGLDLEDEENLREQSVESLLERFTRVQRCEVPVFNWFTTQGDFRSDITLDEGAIGRVFDPRGVPCPPVEGEARFPEAQWTAPTGDDGDELPDDGVVHGWVVMRDGRGGVAHLSFDLAIAD